MKTVFLDGATFGGDIDIKAALASLGDVTVYESTSREELFDRIKDCDVLMLNKVSLDAEALGRAEKLKLICISATGYDPIDVEYCKRSGIAVCNVVGYSTDSVAQLTVALALSLMTRIPEFYEVTASGEYTRLGIANYILPYSELAGKTWGVVGLGNIGKKVAAVAKAFGCRVLAYKRTPEPEFECVSLETLCRESDVISIHTPLTEQTRGLIGENEIALMKENAVVVNVARGAVTDEAALARAIKEKRIAGLGVDVYSKEPFPTEHPFTEIAGEKNVILTPHMAWASKEARARCLEEMVKNTNAFFDGEIRNRVDLV